jgi:RimJ/RimL family protein N-acetyltransferase
MHGRAWWQGRHTGAMRLDPPTLSDGEITVRALRESDVPAIVAACQDPEIPRWTRVPSPYTVEDARRFLAIAASEAAAGDGLALAVADERDRLIGTVGLMALGGEAAEIGYWIAAGARGRGAAARAVVLLRDWAAAALGLRAIEILAHRDNVPSQRVAERAGFADTGELRRAPRMPPGRRDGYKAYRWVAPAAP